jgi:hypothetical protein
VVSVKIPPGGRKKERKEKERKHRCRYLELDEEEEEELPPPPPIILENGDLDPRELERETEEFDEMSRAECSQFQRKIQAREYL